jgi:hypothetical protein
LLLFIVDCVSARAGFTPVSLAACGATAFDFVCFGSAAAAIALLLADAPALLIFLYSFNSKQPNFLSTVIWEEREIATVDSNYCDPIFFLLQYCEKSMVCHVAQGLIDGHCGTRGHEHATGRGKSLVFGLWLGPLPGRGLSQAGMEADWKK